MNSHENQKGFATIEIILVIMIISVLSVVAIPKMSKMLDLAQLNYETKKFVSDFYFAKSLSKSAKFEPEIFNSLPISNGQGIIFSVPTSRRYEIKNGDKLFRENHSLPKKFKITRGNIPVDLYFSDGRILKNPSGTYIFNSAFGTSHNLKLDSVGRLHAERTKNNN